MIKYYTFIQTAKAISMKCLQNLSNCFNATGLTFNEILRQVLLLYDWNGCQTKLIISKWSNDTQILKASATLQPALT